MLTDAGINNLAEILGQGVKNGGMRIILDNTIKIIELEPDLEINKRIAGSFKDAVLNESLLTGSGDVANRMGRDIMLEAQELAA